eukprot:CAMPEP_0183345774 /NCGR_PEP_ID=MMETSP0164_2-20130417/11107_1 /TAXON_ID=221442 /ORGANISM="Coccolithus pelagicus ssp braarudi, Strain PLY182g" /LENGTH=294 /DNA_ID=CAMNT_0025516965 /DNA_START=68 /DNA_END=952 /DNA_ORIENTATION=-
MSRMRAVAALSTTRTSAAPVLSRPLGTRVLSTSASSGDNLQAAGGGSAFERIQERLGRAIRGDATAQAGARRIVQLREQGKSWMEAAREGMTDYKQMRKDDSFQSFNQLLLETESFSMDVLKSQFESALGAQDQMSLMQRAGLKLDSMRGGEQAKAIENIKKGLAKSLEVITAMTPSERRNPELLGSTARARICNELVLADETQIDEVVRQYTWVKIQWDFLHREQAKGSALPLNGDEMQWMMRTQPTRLSFAMMKKEAAARGELPRPSVHAKRERRRENAAKRKAALPLRKFR